jgi:hypothetical protein
LHLLSSNGTEEQLELSSSSYSNKITLKEEDEVYSAELFFSAQTFIMVWEKGNYSNTIELSTS